MRAQPVPRSRGTSPAPSPSPNRHRSTFSTSCPTWICRSFTRSLATVCPRLVSTTGHLSGPADALHAVGDATINQLDAYGVRALTLVGHYDAVAPTSDLWRTKAQVNARGTFLTLFGQSVNEASGTVTMDADRLGFDLDITQQENRHGRLAGAVRLRDDRHAVDAPRSDGQPRARALASRLDHTPARRLLGRRRSRL